MQRGFGLLSNLTVNRSVELGVMAERLGYDSVWFAEHNYSRDGITPCAMLAAQTSRILIGPSVVPIFTRSALLLATTFATLDEASGGRIVLGLGAGSRKLIAGQGIEYRQPLLGLREYVEACRAVWDAGDSRINYHGTIARLEEAELDFAPVRREIPIWLGTTGPRACKLAGAIGNGVMFNAFLPPSYLREAVGWVQSGAEEAGRSLDDFQYSMMLMTVVADSKREAREYMRPILGVYLARLPDIARHTSIWSTYDDLVRAVDTEGAEGGAKLVSDDLVDELTICGTRADCLERIEEYVAGGLNHPIVVGVGDEQVVLEALAPR